MIKMDKGNEQETIPENPKKNANILSLLCFWWTIPILRTGQKREFKTTDIGGALEDYDSRRLGERLESIWSMELSNCKKDSKRKPSLWKCLFIMFGWKNIGYGFLCLALDLGIRLSQPYIIGRILNHFAPANEVTFDEVKLWAAAFLVTLMIQLVGTRQVYFVLSMLGIEVRTALSSLICRKLVKTSLSVNHEVGSGQLINMLTNDATRFDFAPCFTMDLLGGIATLAVLVYLMWREVGVSAIVGIGVVLIFVPIQYLLARKSSTLTVKAAMRTDKRMQLMNEIVKGIQPIKMYAWEKNYAKKTEHLRKLEVHVLRKKAFYVGLTDACSQFLSKLGYFVCALFYALSGNPITAEKMFTVLIYFNIFEDAITLYIPLGVQKFVKCAISVRRIRNFLLVEEAQCLSISQKRTANVTIQLDRVSAKWSINQSENNIDSISVTVGPETLVAVIGKVGSGKSSLLSLILKEMPETNGKMAVQGSISYASQEPWLFHGTVRDNILFGLSMDEERYKSVIEVCALRADLGEFSDGDETLIGERGISVSGGQRARINLARAIYRKADIYLLDDPLSAVDSHVGKHIFEKCIKRFLSGKIVIVCTHQLQYISTADLIILMDNGTIKSQGAPKDFQNVTGDLENFFVKHIQESSEESEKTKENELCGTVPNQSEDAEEEITGEGKISWRIFWSYVRAGCSPVSCVVLIAILGLTQAFASGYAYWLSFWVDFEENFHQKGNSNSTSLPVLGLINHEKCVWVYGVLLAILVIFICIETLSFYYFSMEASKALHDSMFNTVSKATMRFFNQNPSGRILSRFSKDMGMIDDELPETLLDALKCILKVLGVVMIVSSLSFWLIFAVICVWCLLVFLRQYFIATLRSLKRLQGVTRSPMCTHANSIMQGLATIRAVNMSEKVIADFDSYQNINSSTSVYSLGVNKCFGNCLDLVGALYTIMSIYTFLFLDIGLSGGEVGLGITQLLTLVMVFQWAVRQSAEVESSLTSVERVMDFEKVESEAAAMETPCSAPKGWPSHGEIVFDDVCLRYKQATPLVLKKVAFSVTSGEKVGIVGRTGAGKSSLINALFRLHPIEGRITIDGVEIGSIGLRDLRSHISVIPQAPFLATGTLRYNLDPFEEISDERLWRVLDEVKMKSFVEDLPGKLSSPVFEGGVNLSVGQRQLICLARALLRNNKILVMDEATANLDTYTDHLIQSTIRQKFSSCTVLTIAHRLHSVIDSDRILVMEHGSVAEFGEPYELLKKADSHFNDLVNRTGHTHATALRALAETAYNQRHTLL